MATQPIMIKVYDKRLHKKLNNNVYTLLYRFK
jgi:hypothetical protein